MAGEKQEIPWPIPAFSFKVSFDDKEIAFQEASGLDAEYDVVEYRAGNSKAYSVNKMPGLRKSSDITLKKGVFAADKDLYTYFNTVAMNTFKRMNVTISLLDEKGEPLFTWSLTNAFPKKFTAPSLNAKNSEAAIEEIVLAHEGLSLTKP